VNVSDPAMTRAQELWVAKLMVRQEWTLPEALHWIIYRDGEQVGRALQFGASPLVTDRASVLIAACQLLGAQVGTEAEPFEALELEIIQGAVVAVGDVQMWSAGRARRVLKPGQWESLCFYRDPYSRGDAASMAYRERSDTRYLTALRFERVGLVAAFPARSAAVSAAWNPGPQERLTEWCRSPRAEAGARERIKVDGGAASEKAICRELLAMWREAARENGTARSIETIRAN